MNEYNPEFQLDFTSFVPGASLLLLNGFAFLNSSQTPLIWKCVFLLLGFIVAGYLADRIARKKKGAEFKEFHFETLFSKEKFLQIFSRNAYGKLGVGLIFAFFALYQSMEYLNHGIYVSYLLSSMGIFMTYLSLIQSHCLNSYLF
ncbi:hypothetical protein ACVRXQ_13065 [Streptococcus panodentis]|uniref:hypothetical protein n=1 Tax=Streptococcus panodentis TaxID=1581472 RepID=UPI001FD9C5BD|nr:hypothetical protein [Streptococcus panodentis]